MKMILLRFIKDDKDDNGFLFPGDYLSSTRG